MQRYKRKSTSKPRPPKKRGEMNRLEADFGAALDRIKATEPIRDCYYEALTFLASRCEVEPPKKGDTTYCADFVLSDESDRYTVFEVKGEVKEQDRIRFKASAEKFSSIAFYMVERRVKSSDWMLTPYGRRACLEVDRWRALLNNREPCRPASTATEPRSSSPRVRAAE